MTNRQGCEAIDSPLPGKASKVQVYLTIVPQADTGGQLEIPQALERSLVKEPGKMVP